MLPEIPPVPQSVTSLLWIGIVVLVGVVTYLWRATQRQRDRTEKDLRDALAEERAAHEKTSQGPGSKPRREKK